MFKNSSQQTSDREGFLMFIRVESNPRCPEVLVVIGSGSAAHAHRPSLSSETPRPSSCTHSMETTRRARQMHLQPVHRLCPLTCGLLGFISPTLRRVSAGGAGWYWLHALPQFTGAVTLTDNKELHHRGCGRLVHHGGNVPVLLLPVNSHVLPGRHLPA